MVSLALLRIGPLSSHHLQNRLASMVRRGHEATSSGVVISITFDPFVIPDTSTIAVHATPY